MRCLPCDGLISKTASILCLVAVLFGVSIKYFRVLGPTPLGYINKFWTPHEITLALNPNFKFVKVLRNEITTLRDEFHGLRAIAMRPRSEYRSLEYPGAVKDDDQTVGWNTLYLRVGTVDTCLAKHFPKTMQILDQQLGTRVHTAFFSELNPGNDNTGRIIPPHCGQLRGLFRVLTVLDGEKLPGKTSSAMQGALVDHDACLTRFASECPENVTQSPKSKTVRYNVGDVVVFNDFTCHWVENYSAKSRIALVINVDRPDLATWRNTFTAWGSRLFARRKLRVFLEGSKKVCAMIEGV